MREGILGIIMVILLISGFRRLSYQSLMSYTFISLFFTVTFLVYVMTEYLSCYLGCKEEPKYSTWSISLSSSIGLLLLPLPFMALFPFSASFLIRSLKWLTMLGIQVYRNSWPVTQPIKCRTHLNISCQTWKINKQGESVTKQHFKHLKVREFR